jgi:hypothetical protein
MDMQRFAIIETPFRSTISPFISSVREHNQQWAWDFGLVKDEESQQRFFRMNFASLASRLYPYADYEQLELITDWIAWIFAIDDLCDESSLGTDPTKLHSYLESLLSMMVWTAADLDDPIKAALSNLWERSCAYVDDEWKARYFRSLAAYFEGSIIEAIHRNDQIVPSMVEYSKMREYTAAIEWMFCLLELGNKLYFSCDILAHPSFREMMLVTGNIMGWFNDLVSVEKEIERGDIVNLLFVLQNERNLSLEDAFESAVKMHNNELRKLFLFESSMPPINAYLKREFEFCVESLHIWISGQVEWVKETSRYALVA